jgi:hypothetical protein
MTLKDMLYVVLTLLFVMFLAGFGVMGILNQTAHAESVDTTKNIPKPVAVSIDTTPTEISLEGLWKFQIDPDTHGQEEKWNDPKFDDKKWTEINVPGYWEDQGINIENKNYVKDELNEPYSGFAWYRKKIYIPATWTENSVKPVYISLGKIDDCDLTYWNGEEIGHTGIEHQYPDKETRVYTIPPSIIKPGKENVIAVRVEDMRGKGGIYAGPVYLSYGKKPVIPPSSGPDRVNVGGSVHILPGETVKDAVAIGGSLKIEGQVTGDAVCIGGSLSITSTAEVYGDAVCIGGSLHIDPNAKVHGDKVTVGSIPGVNFGNLFGKGFAWGSLFYVITIFSIIYLCVTILLVVLVPERLQLISDMVEQSPGKSFATGCAAAILLIPLLLFLLITCIGIPLIPVVIIVAIVAWLLGYASIALVIGRKLVDTFKWQIQTLLWIALLGVLVLILVKFIPCIGWLLVFILELAGFGAVILTKFGKPKKRPPVPSVPSVVPST